MAESAAGRVTISPLAGQPAPRQMLVDPTRLEREYYARTPDMADPNQRVIFGTSGHRGSPLAGAFTEAHIAAITQAICDYRRAQGIDGPLCMGKDTHALSEPAQRTALEVLVANGRPRLLEGSSCFGVRRAPGSSSVTTAPSTTDKTADLDLLAADAARRQTGEHYRDDGAVRRAVLPRIDAGREPARLAKLSPEAVRATTVAGDPIIAKLTRARQWRPDRGLKVARLAAAPRAPRTSTRSTRKASWTSHT